MNHNLFIEGPMTRARRLKRERTARTIEAIKPYIYGVILCALLLGAMHADHVALQAGIMSY